uniref:Germin-like protein n=1 Tax=Ananas comosus var. bracteatus TaxID=296719 RepID=A0A6V7PSB8_ANACO|nr:unnamed protein product [Ananas comosus var. bracteatus]
MARSSSSLLALFSLLLLFLSPSLAADPDMLQDICVADLTSTVKVNGFVCKADVTADDFFFKGWRRRGHQQHLRLSGNGRQCREDPGPQHTGCVHVARRHRPGGPQPSPHSPRATEIVFVLEGTLDVGFITTANKFVAKTISAGDVFVFPRGLVHFQKNNGNKPASAIAAFNSQLPGRSPSRSRSSQPRRPCRTTCSPRPSRSAPRRPRRSNPALRQKNKHMNKHDIT